MYGCSSLSEEPRKAGVALFETLLGRQIRGSKARGGRTGCGLYGRWRVRGGTTLVTKPTKRLFSFGFKLAVGLRYLAGETKVALARSSSCPTRS